MEHNPSLEANSSSSGQYIIFVLWNLNIHCRVHNNPPLVAFLSQLNPVHTTTIRYGLSATQRLCTEINSLKTFINEQISEHFVEQSVLTSSRRKYLLITAVVQSSVRTVLLRGETHHLTPPCHANYNPVNTRQTSFIPRQQPQLPRHPPTFELGMVASFSRDK
jgi:hypothetical protein